MPVHSEDLEYLRPEGGAPLLARYYRPEGTGPFPAVLEVHGGAISFHSFPGQPHSFIARDPAAPDALRSLGLITDFIHHQTG